MGEQVKKSTQKSKTKEAEEETAAVDVKDEQLAEDVDDLLDEIDLVLEENAEEFVNSYIQKGGQ